MLVTHNGRPANLLNGGETPILVPSGLGTTGVEFKEFGVQLDAVPHILATVEFVWRLKPPFATVTFQMLLRWAV